MRTARPTFLRPRPTTLHGRDVVLRPITRRDLPELERVPDDPAWDLLLRRPAGAGVLPDSWLGDAMRGVRSGTECAWTIRDMVDGRLLGSTRFLNVDLTNRRVEIGATWLLADARGSSANLDSKLALLDHAFDVLGVQRVHLQADVHNERSRRAIEGLGATLEGVLRRHIVRPDGTTRDTAVYSIVDDEWAVRRAGIVEQLTTRTPNWRLHPSNLLMPTAAEPFADLAMPSIEAALG